jgi:hypothetical protein
MKKTFIIATLFGALVLTIVAEEFYLKSDTTEKVYGPFSTVSGSKVTVDANKLTVVQKSQTDVEKKLNKIKIPEIKMTSTTLKTALQLLMTQTKNLDPKKIGVNFVFAKTEFPGQDFNISPMVTLNMKDVSALQVLKSMMEQTDCHYKILESSVVVLPNK